MTTTMIVATHKPIETALFINHLKMAIKKHAHLSELEGIDNEIKTASESTERNPTDTIDITKGPFRIIMIGGYKKSTAHPFARARDDQATWKIAMNQLFTHTEAAMQNEDCDSLIFLCDFNLFCSGDNVCTTRALAQYVAKHDNFKAKTNIVFCITGNGNPEPKEVPSESEQKALNNLAEHFNSPEDKSHMDNYVVMKEGDKSNIEAATGALEEIARNASAVNKMRVSTALADAADAVTKSLSPRTPPRTPRETTTEIAEQLKMTSISTPSSATSSVTTVSPVQSFPSPINSKKTELTPTAQKLQSTVTIPVVRNG